MARRSPFAALLLVLLVCLASGCSGDGSAVGGENGSVSRYERAEVLAVDADDQTAQIRILEHTDDLSISWGTLEMGEEGEAAFGGDLPAEGDDIVLAWIGSPNDESTFPVDVHAWQPTVDFYAGFEGVHTVRLSASLLQFISMTPDELMEDLAEQPGFALAGRVDEGDVVVVFTSEQLEAYREDLESSLDRYAASLREAEEVTAVEVSEDRTCVTLHATPELLDKPVLVGEAFMALPGICATLQATDGVEEWGVEVIVIDEESGAEVMRVTLPEESATLSTEGWTEAVAQGLAA